MSPWDLEGDGKAFFGFYPEEEWDVKLMRKWNPKSCYDTLKVKRSG